LRFAIEKASEALSALLMCVKRYEYRRVGNNKVSGKVRPLSISLESSGMRLVAEATELQVDEAIH
jgi:hypothetical protein